MLFLLDENIAKCCARPTAVSAARQFTFDPDNNLISYDLEEPV